MHNKPTNDETIIIKKIFNASMNEAIDFDVKPGGSAVDPKVFTSKPVNFGAKRYANKSKSGFADPRLDPKPEGKGSVTWKGLKYGSPKPEMDLSGLKAGEWETPIPEPKKEVVLKPELPEPGEKLPTRTTTPTTELTTKPATVEVPKETKATKSSGGIGKTIARGAAGLGAGLAGGVAADYATTAALDALGVENQTARDWTREIASGAGAGAAGAAALGTGVLAGAGAGAATSAVMYGGWKAGRALGSALAGEPKDKIEKSARAETEEKGFLDLAAGALGLDQAADIENQQAKGEEAHQKMTSDPDYQRRRAEHQAAIEAANRTQSTPPKSESSVINDIISGQSKPATEFKLPPAAVQPGSTQAELDKAFSGRVKSGVAKPTKSEFETPPEPDQKVYNYPGTFVGSETQRTPTATKTVPTKTQQTPPFETPPEPDQVKSQAPKKIRMGSAVVRNEKGEEVTRVVYKNPQTGQMESEDTPTGVGTAPSKQSGARPPNPNVGPPGGYAGEGLRDWATNVLPPSKDNPYLKQTPVPNPLSEMYYNILSQRLDEEKAEPSGAQVNQAAYGFDPRGGRNARKALASLKSGMWRGDSTSSGKIKSETKPSPIDSQFQPSWGEKLKPHVITLMSAAQDHKIELSKEEAVNPGNKDHQRLLSMYPKDHDVHKASQAVGEIMRSRSNA